MASTIANAVTCCNNDKCRPSWDCKENSKRKENIAQPSGLIQMLPLRPKQ